MLSEITGRKIKYLNPDKESYTEQITGSCVPKETAAFLVGFGEAIGHHEFDTHHSYLETLLKRKPTLLSDFLKSVYQS